MKIAGLSFDHMHMGDLLRQVHEHPDGEIVGIADAEPLNAHNVADVAAKFEIGADKIYTDYQRCLEETKPEMVILCPAIARHAEFVELAASYGAHILVEKPFAISLAEADRMIAAAEKAGVTLAINWPLAWYPPHVTTKRLIDEGTIGEVLEVHYYDGNRGPMRHVHDKIDVTEVEANQRKSKSWFYKKESGGGSLIDYLGYGVTLGSWFMGGAQPMEVTSMTLVPPGLEVDEHSVTVCNYGRGLSKFETRWGTFTDPWTNQPQPKCGFNVVGTKGTIASYDYELSIRVQTKNRPEGFTLPVDELQAPNRSALEHFIAHLQGRVPLHGPLTPALCRIGQQIVDTALDSSREKKTLPLAK